MSNRLAEFVKKQALLNQLQNEISQLQDDPQFQAELEFKSQLEKLMSDYDKSAADVIGLLQPKPAESTPAGSSKPRRKRKLKIYKNPNTGEMVETRGGNHKVLKAWKDDYGDETVESWMIREEV